MNKKNTNLNILVLGSDGMVGRAVYHYLSAIPELTVYGTTRKQKQIPEKIIFFEAEEVQQGFHRIYQKVHSISYVINCIGITNPSASLKDIIYINALFPHLLEERSGSDGYKLIHISTDGVFPPTVGVVSEGYTPLPFDNYGRSKLLGETTTKHAITVRSSFIGFDPINGKGVLERALREKENFKGFTNQIWTGCTTLQFAEFCKDIIQKDLFLSLRNESSIFHFSPLGPISKYNLILQFVKLINSKWEIIQAAGETRERILSSEFDDLLNIQKYKGDLEEVLTALIEFENQPSSS